MTLLAGGVSSGNGALEQPLSAFFELKMGGLKKIYQYPEMPIDFEYDSSSDGSSVKITLFDVTGTQVENAIWNSRDPVSGIAGGTFQFGYLGKQPKISNEYQFQLESWHPQFSANSFTVTLIGNVILSPMASTNQVSGTMEECLNELTKFHNMQLNINPPFGIDFMKDTGYTNKDSTALTEMQHIKWINETDWAFINRLLKWARDQQGKGGYLAYLSTNNGQATLNIVRPQNTSPDMTFTVQERDSTVISWQPTLDFTSAIFGANDLQQNGYQRGTGDTQKIVCDQNVTKPFQANLNGTDSAPVIKSLPANQSSPDQLVYTNSENMPSNVTGSAIRSRPGASSSSYAGVNPVLNESLKAQLQGTSATLVILGDPSIDPILGQQNSQQIQLVEVKCFYPHNYYTGNVTAPTPTGQELHYTSGTYLLDGVKHMIKAGEYQTILSLTRDDVPTPPTAVQMYGTSDTSIYVNTSH